MMLRSKSYNEKLSLIRQNTEISQRSRYEEFVQRYSLKQKVSTERKTKFKEKLKERAINSQKRHTEAALRRQAIEEDKKNKIIARKTKSTIKEPRSVSCEELRVSATPGVFINSLKTNKPGTAGFGKGFDGKSETSLPSSKQSSIPHLRIGSGRCFRSLSRLDSSLSTKSNDISVQEFVKAHPVSEYISRKGDDVTSNGSTSSIVSQKIPRRINNCSKRYQSVNSKRVSFDSPQYEVSYVKPVIKKSLIIRTPETKKGILMKMSELSSTQRNNGHLKYEPGMVMRVILPRRDSSIEFINRNDVYMDKNDEDDSNISGVNESTNTDFSVKSYPITSIPALCHNGDLSEQINCGNLLRTCEIEKLNRKMKLAKLHQDLMKIERDTKMLNDKNYETTLQIVNNSQKLKEKQEDNFHIQRSFAKKSEKVLTNNNKPSLAAIRYRIDQEKDNYLTETKFKGYCPVYDANNSSFKVTQRTIKSNRMSSS